MYIWYCFLRVPLHHAGKAIIPTPVPLDMFYLSVTETSNEIVTFVQKYFDWTLSWGKLEKTRGIQLSVKLLTGSS